MQCRLLLHFIILGFHLVASYPNTETKFRKEASYPKNLDVKFGHSHNEDFETYPNQQKVLPPVYEDKSDESEHVEVMPKTKNSNKHGLLEINNKDHDNSKAYEGQNLNAYGYDQEQWAGTTRHHEMPQNYDALTDHRLQISGNNRHEGHSTNYPLHPGYHELIDKLQEYYNDYKYQDPYYPLHEVYGSGYHNEPSRSEESHLPVSIRQYYQTPYGTPVSDPYYRGFEDEYYKLKYPNHGLKSEYKIGIDYVPHDNYWKVYEDNVERRKILDTEPDSTKSNESPTYVDKYFKPELMMPIQSTTIRHNIQGVNEEFEAKPTATPETLKWVEHFDEKVPHDNDNNSDKQSVLSQDKGLEHNIELKNETTADPKIIEENKDKLSADLPSMKPISEPLIWFRPDEKFWQSVENGETTYDKVVFVQVRPTAIIERNTIVFQYENGTIVKDYNETFWEHEDDPSPKTITSKRVIEHPDGSSTIS